MNLLANSKKFPDERLHFGYGHRHVGFSRTSGRPLANWTGLEQELGLLVRCHRPRNHGGTHTGNCPVKQAAPNTRGIRRAPSVGGVHRELRRPVIQLGFTCPL